MTELPPQRTFFQLFVGFWAPVLLWSSGGTLEVIGREHVDPKRPTLYIANHQSAADIPMMFIAIPVNLRFVAKKQLVWVPILGFYIWIAGYILVDRGNRAKAIASLERAAQKIRRGINLIMFAEGTRSPDGRMYRGHTGIARIVLEAGVPVLPVAMIGTDRVQPIGRPLPRLGHSVGVRVGAPLDYSEHVGTVRNPKLLREITDDIMAHVRRLSGQEYVDRYASREKSAG